MLCQGYAKTKGRRCRAPARRNSRYCRVHDPSIEKCVFIMRNGERCGNLPELGSTNACYCRYHPVSDVSPSDLFRIDNLRRERHRAVQEYRREKDAYTLASVPAAAFAGGRRDNKELDHVVELHIFRDSYEALERRGTGFDRKKKDLRAFLREEVVNEYQNLNYTTKDINRIKFIATRDFQRDYNMDRIVASGDEQGLFPYLDNANTNNTLSRDVSGRISRELTKSFEWAIGCVHTRDGILSEEMADSLQRNFTAMHLH